MLNTAFKAWRIRLVTAHPFDGLFLLSSYAVKDAILMRPFTPSDIQSLMGIQSACYPANLLEEAEHLTAKHQQSPSSCWVATQHQHVLAYLLTHPWSGDTPPALNAPLPTPNQSCDIYFIHDLAVHPSARGLGLAQQLLDTALKWARQEKLQKIRLIAIAGAANFWIKQGLSPVKNVNKDLSRKLADYGTDTHYLEAAI
ncbi:GNAT family N-acetyltransferase [Iodobacter sp. CM08]|uniref:GNAT family N-acetyltransferase n=1 Tax=Iodobacter sp. CM08 TaxID=3085902 RepID=UPI0029815206|nr:GNAT family N-acetyltransferase [Iodobacter sp. CM08]MDW5415669.1 GNAT family N-acetyltransferase [Iodobacter sp. CM08]